MRFNDIIVLKLQPIWRKNMENCLNTSAFGKNDIRGIFPKEVNSEVFLYAAMGYVKWVLNRFKENGMPKRPEELCFCVCMDARLHSRELKDAVIKGITLYGANVVDIGLAPTPMGYFSEFAKMPNDILKGCKINGALIITASHNPSEYNGLKMTFNKGSLSEADIKEVKAAAQSVYELAKEGRLPITQKGFIEEFNLVETYAEKLLDGFSRCADGLKIVVDSANATAGIVAPNIYREMGAEIVELYSNPDGNFPNHHPNPSDESTLDDIKKAVVENGADFGIAFDGDSDRIGLVDSDGKMVTGDKLLLIYALDLINALKIRGEKPTVVSEVKCSQVLYDTINKEGGNAVMYKTGHGYIKSKMKETGALLAGEMSGHIFFKDRYYGFDDAIYAGMRLVEIVSKNKKENPNFKVQDLLEPFNKVFISNEVRFKCPNEFKQEVLDKLNSKVCDELFNSKIKDIVTLDGLRIIFEDGFALIRKSNTEPVFTMRFEANTKDKCECYQNALVNTVDELVKEISAQSV